MNITNSIPRSTLRPFALAVVLGLLGSAQALASVPPSVKVNYADLNLSTQAGAQTLYNRIAGAARTVCGFPGSTLLDQSIWKACYRDAISEAVAKVNSPLLTAIQTGHAAPVVARR
jgi:UrcA family protein